MASAIFLEHKFGSSPRVRGTVVLILVLGCDPRFIPARAGNGHSRLTSTHSQPVHPRACGERMAGPTLEHPGDGSSPRVRGTGPASLSTVAAVRFIPARAGNGRRRLSGGFSEPVHPRACGERFAVVPWGASIVGSSPRVRGTGWPCAAGCHRSSGSSPRVRGTVRLRQCTRSQTAVHPRACGERTRRYVIDNM